MESEFSSEQTLQADLRQYITLLLRWAWLIVLAAILAGGAAFVTSNLQDPVYQATTTMLINEAPSTRSSEYTALLTSERLARTYSEMLTKRPVLDDVYERLELDTVYRSPESIANAVSVQLVRDTQLIELSVEGTDPELAAMIANSLVEVFVEQNQELSASRFAESKRSLEDQLASMQGQIHNTVLAINALGDITEVGQKRKQLEIQIAAYEQVYQNIVQNMVTDDVATINQAELDQQLNSLQEQIIEISNLLLVTDNQVEQNLYEARLKAYQDTYQRLLEDLLLLEEAGSQDTSEEQLLALDQRIDQLSSELAELGGSAQVDIERDRLEANLTQYRQSYNNLLQSYEQVRVSEAESTSNVVQVEPAVTPRKPIRPRVMMNTALAGVVGGMLAVGAIFLMEALDDTIKSPDDVNRHLKLPVIGTILRHKTENDDPVTADSPRAPTSEAFRSLRTNIRYASVDYPIRSILVTSPSASEGKSTVATNLANVLAQGGDSTVLLDADMRRPMLHRRLKLDNKFGLSSFFVFQSLFERPEELPPGTIQTTKTEGLSIITSGKRPPNPSELLASEKMYNLINRLSQEWELVVLDSPPVLAVTDATVLAPRVDGVVLVIKPGETKLEAAQQAVQQLRRVGANLIGVVLNGVDPHSSRYGYYYRYEYYYDADKTGDGADVRRKLPQVRRVGQWVFWGLLATLLVAVGGWYAFASSAGTLPGWMGTPTPKPTQVSVAGETELIVDAGEMSDALPTPTLTSTSQAVVAEQPADAETEDENLDEEAAPTQTPTITPTPLPPTPGPGFLTPFGAQNEYLLHQVKFGDNLANLAQRYSTDRDVIMLANGMVPNQSLQPDQVIVIIPSRTDSFDLEPLNVFFLDEDVMINDLAVSYSVTPDELRAYNDLGPGSVIPGGRWLIFPKREIVPTPTPTTIPVLDLSLAIKGPFGPDEAYVLHQVTAGESVPFLADLYLTSQDVIRATNIIQTSIRIGDVLVILPERTDPTDLLEFTVVQVEQDTTVDELADELGVFPADLILYNDLLSGQTIPAGEWIIYPTLE